MKIIKTSAVLVNFKGEPMKEDGKEIPIGIVLSNILAAHSANPALCWQLGKKFACDKTVELKAEDVVFVKKAIEDSATGDKKWLNAQIAGQLLEIIETPDVEKKAKE